MAVRNHCYQSIVCESLTLLEQTCLLCVKSRTLWPCFFHSFNIDSTTIIFPDRCQKPNSSTSSFTTSSVRSFPMEPNSFGPPVDKSGWLQTLRRVMRPGNTCKYRITNHNISSWIQENIIQHSVNRITSIYIQVQLSTPQLRFIIPFNKTSSYWAKTTTGDTAIIFLVGSKPKSFSLQWHNVTFIKQSR